MAKADKKSSQMTKAAAAIATCRPVIFGANFFSQLPSGMTCCVVT